MSDKDDCISRRAAIEAIEKAKMAQTPDGEIYVAKYNAEMNIQLLPSVQPEPSEITDERAILHLQSTGWMQNHNREIYESGLKERLADDSESYDSLIPHEDDGDTISRQMAIDALDCINGVEEVLRSLPSAQPEIIRCKDCDWWTKQEDSVQGRCELMQMYPAGGWYCGNARRRPK